MLAMSRPAALHFFAMRIPLLASLALLGFTFLHSLPAEEAKTNRFEKEILAYEAKDKQTPPPQGAILFTGASGIRTWNTLAQDFPGLTVLNRGFGGSTVADSVHFAERIVIPYHPKTIVLQAGGNDIHGGKTPEQVLADFKAYFEKVRAKLPEVKIVYFGINPSLARWGEREQQQKANALIREYLGTQKNAVFLGIWDEILGANGEPRPELFVADRLHPSAEGFKLRAKFIRPVIE